MEGENGSERENKCKLTPRYEKTPGSRVPREEKPGENIEMRPLNPNTTNQNQDHEAVQNLGETAAENGGENAESEGKTLST